MQDQRIADLEESMANMALQWEQEKERIVNALKKERAFKKQAEAENKATSKELHKVISILRRGPSPAEAVKYQLNVQTPSTQPCLTKQMEKLDLVNSTLKKELSDKELRWEAEKDKILKALRAERECKRRAEAEKDNILEALRAERECRRRVEAEKKPLNKEPLKVIRLQNENTTLKQILIEKQEEIEFTKRRCISESRQAKKARDEIDKRYLETEAQLRMRVNELTEVVADDTVKIIAMEEAEKARDESDKRYLETEAQLRMKVNKLTEVVADNTVKIIAMEEAENARDESDKRYLETEAQLRMKVNELTKVVADDTVKIIAMEEDKKVELAGTDRKVSQLQDQIHQLEEANVALVVSNLNLKAMSELSDREKSRIKKAEDKVLKESAKREKKEKKEEKKEIELQIKRDKKEKARIKKAEDKVLKESAKREEKEKKEEKKRKLTAKRASRVMVGEAVE